MASPRLPVTLQLLPGLRWRGSLTVLSREPEGWAVSFDAEIVGAKHDRFVYDRAVLTPKQLADWTGAPWAKGGRRG